MAKRQAGKNGQNDLNGNGDSGAVQGKARNTPPDIEHDKPIQTADRDELGHARLAHTIARQLAMYEEHHSLVVAINAPWGTGKTSLMNMIEGELTPKDGTSADLDLSKVSCIRFNPWHFKGVEQLILMFFDALARATLVNRSDNMRKGAATAIRGLGVLIAMGNSVAGEAIDELGKRLGEDKSLEERRNAINAELQRLGRRFVIFIDDIDRLESDAMQMLFRLVRLVGDLDHVTYVLAFDRVAVIKTLSVTTGWDATAYLEKVVDVGFDLPPPSQARLSDMLERACRTYFNDEFASGQIDPVEWLEMLDAGFISHFTTVRQVKRFMSGVRFSYPLVRGEVAVADFLAVELIRLFHPEVYRELPRWVKEVTEPSPRLVGQSAARSVAEAMSGLLDPILDISAPGHRDQLSRLLVWLFPTLPRGSQLNSSTRSRDGVFQPGHADRYLSLSVPDWDVSNLELKRYLSLFENEPGLAEQTNHFMASPRAAQFVRRLGEATLQMSHGQPAAVLRCFLNMPDSMIASGYTALAAPRDSMHEKCAVMLQRLWAVHRPDTLDFATLVDSVSKATAIELMTRMVAGLTRVGKSDQPFRDDSFASKKESDALQRAAAERLEHAMSDGAFWMHPRLAAMVFRYRDWAGDAAVTQRVDAWIGEDDGRYLALVEALQTTPFNMSTGTPTKPILQGSYLSTLIVNWDPVERLRTLAADGRDEDHRSRASRLLDMLESTPVA
jgi:predicted KAP-like P-loop ATPase